MILLLASIQICMENTYKKEIKDASGEINTYRSFNQGERMTDHHCEHGGSNAGGKHSNIQAPIPMMKPRIKHSASESASCSPPYAAMSLCCSSPGSYSKGVSETSTLGIHNFHAV